MNPTGQVPVLKTPEGNIFESDAMATYAANLSDAGKKLLGSTPMEAALVRQWIDFFNNQARPVLSPYVTLYMPWGKYDEAAAVAAKKLLFEGPEGMHECKHISKVWDEALAGKTWICG